jgi:integrase
MLRRWKYVIANPLADVEDLKEMEPDTKFYTEKEIQVILKGSKGMWYDMFFISINTGCRGNELLSLKWNQNFDFNTRMVIIQAPKTKKIRYIPMTDALHAHLLKMKAKSKHDNVVCFPDGRQPDKDETTKHWAWWLTKWKIKKKGLSFRNTRHTCATHLRAQGVDIAKIADILGHSSLAMTKRYAKMSQDKLREAMGKIGYGKLP